MKNRNVLYFVIGSMILLGAQFWLSSRYAKPAPPVQVQAPAPEAPKAQPTGAPAPAPVAQAAPANAPTGLKAAD
ncbi:MAG TPA: hypothetical protein VJ528_10995, partial [Geothrix sp.]|nr:hypothetical protein [Geothrix sp.]